MDPDAQTLARAVRARRLELRLSMEEAAARARIPETSWRLIEQGTQRPKSDLMLGALCRALEWTPATIEHLLRNDIQLNGSGEMVVDLDATERAASTPAPEPELQLDLTGLTPAQLREVQDFIDYLRERLS